MQKPKPPRPPKIAGRLARLLQEPVHPFVEAHAHMSDGIDPQPRRLAAADAAIGLSTLLRTPKR